MTRIRWPRWSPMAAVALAMAVFPVAGCDDDTTPSNSSGNDAGVDSATGSTDTAMVDAANTPDVAQGGADTVATADSRDGVAADVPPPPPPDLDVAVVRFNANGTLDTTFGTNGIARVDFGPGSGATRDSLWGLAKDSQNRLLLFGSKKGDGPRTDTDRVVFRLTANGAVDTSFATMGMHTLNMANLSDHARNGLAQGDGKIVASGYVSAPTGVGTQAANRIVLLRLGDDGKPDPTFGVMGIMSSAPFVPADPLKTEWGMVEAYGAVQQAGANAGKYVTTGYGRAASSGQVDMVSTRYTATGELDTTWGTKGVVTLDLIGDHDRGRNLLALPDGRVLIVGSGTPVAMNVNPMVVMLKSDGALDTSFDGDGYKLYDFARPDEAFFGVALSASGNWAVGTGYRAGAVAGVMEDDDATLLLLPLGGSGTEVAKAVPVSESQNDRFWAAAFDANDKAYGAGFVTEGGDSRMIVARYGTDGAPDATFGTAGVASVNVAAGAGTEETARGVVVQSDGKIVIAGVFEKR